MQIAVVGGGKVGFTLARQLLAEGHEITIIDQSEKVIEQISNQMDVIGCVGNGASYALLQSLDMEKMELLVAVTASDEINMLCCLIAHKLGAKHTVARVRNPEYAQQLYFLKDDLGLSMSINPERASAKEIGRILRFPSAASVELFAKGRAELVASHVPEGGPLDGIRLKDLPGVTGSKVLICAVEREERVVIPSGDFVIQGGDTLYITGEPVEMEKAFRKMHMLVNRARTVMITGGGRITYYLAEALIKEGVAVKIIEQNPVRAEELAANLPKAVVLVGDAADHELLMEEGVEKQDAFVALTGLDEGNILSALYAHRMNVPKVIAKINNDNLVSLVKNDLVKGSGLQSLISPKKITANQILRYVRALDAGRTGGDFISLYKLVGGRVEVLEFLAEASGAYLDIPLRDLPLKKNILIACIVQNERTVIPGGADCIRAGNGVLVVTVDERLHALSDILEHKE